MTRHMLQCFVSIVGMALTFRPHWKEEFPTTDEELISIDDMWDAAWSFGHRLSISHCHRTTPFLFSWRSPLTPPSAPACWLYVSLHLSPEHSSLIHLLKWFNCRRNPLSTLSSLNKAEKVAVKGNSWGKPRRAVRDSRPAVSLSSKLTAAFKVQQKFFLCLLVLVTISTFLLLAAFWVSFAANKEKGWVCWQTLASTTKFIQYN